MQLAQVWEQFAIQAFSKRDRVNALADRELGADLGEDRPVVAAVEVLGSQLGDAIESVVVAQDRTKNRLLGFDETTGLTAPAPGWT